MRRRITVPRRTGPRLPTIPLFRRTRATLRTTRKRRTRFTRTRLGKIRRSRVRLVPMKLTRQNHPPRPLRMRRSRREPRALVLPPNRGLKASRLLRQRFMRVRPERVRRKQALRENPLPGNLRRRRATALRRRKSRLRRRSMKALLPKRSTKDGNLICNCFHWPVLQSALAFFLAATHSLSRRCLQSSLPTALAGGGAADVASYASTTACRTPNGFPLQDSRYIRVLTPSAALAGLVTCVHGSTVMRLAGNLLLLQFFTTAVAQRQYRSSGKLLLLAKAADD